MIALVLTSALAGFGLRALHEEDLKPSGEPKLQSNMPEPGPKGDFNPIPEPIPDPIGEPVKIP
jgi:hypothetical protein